MKPGTQIAYIPSHVSEGNIKHPDVEFGFVVSKGWSRSNCHFCRYWRKGYLGELRTLANSELTPNSCLVEYTSVPQELVDTLLKGISEAQTKEIREG